MVAIAGNILLITGTKLDSHFPKANFILMATTYSTDMAVTQTMVAFLFMYDMQ